jgi:hypothetical protein
LKDSVVESVLFDERLRLAKEIHVKWTPLMRDMSLGAVVSVSSGRFFSFQGSSGKKLKLYIVGNPIYSMAKLSVLLAAVSGHFTPSEWAWLQEQPEFGLVLKELKSWRDLVRIFDLGDGLVRRVRREKEPERRP